MARTKKKYACGQKRGGGKFPRLSREKHYPGSRETPKTYGRLPY